MAADISKAPTPPHGLRPGQIGVVVIGRVIMGDIAATMVDLSIRELLRIEESHVGDRASWLLSSQLASAPRHRTETLLTYERALLKGLTDQGSRVRLPALDSKVLNVTRRELIRDAVHLGWLHHLHHDKRTRAGEELARHVRAFQGELRRLRTHGNAEDLRGVLLPYALHFGLVERDEPVLARFANAFVTTFAYLEGWRPPAPRRPDFEPVDVVTKPTIDEQIMSPDVAAALWVTGW